MGAGRFIAAAAVAVLVATIAVADAAPAFAARPRVAALKQTRLTLTVAHGVASQPVQHRAVLICTPVGGTHKDAKDACAVLAKVNGNFAKLQLDGGVCTMQYDPVTVTALGHWRGRKVSYRHTYGNACTLTTTTGPVFSL